MSADRKACRLFDKNDSVGVAGGKVCAGVRSTSIIIAATATPKAGGYDLSGRCRVMISHTQ